MDTMKEWIDLLREAYRLRDASLIGRLAEWLDEDCVIVGTSLNEISRGRAGFAELLACDFKYWIDIDIAPAYDTETFGDLCLYTLTAEGRGRFTVNDKTYGRYAGYMRDIFAEEIPAYAKAVKAIWELDHLLASKKGVRHTDAKKINVHLFTRADRILLIAYSYAFDKNHVDCFAGAQQDIDEDFAADRALFSADAALSARLIAQTAPDGLRFRDVVAESHGDWFVGCGTLVNDAPIEEEIARDFAALDEENTPYRRLYCLRKRLGETLRLYSFGDRQEIMTRVFGVLRDGEIVRVLHTYPFYWILED